MKIKIFITGGTFDKEYDELNGKLFFNDTHIPSLLDRGRCHLDVQIRTLMMVDSLEMTAEDRELILEQCRHSDLDRILITHGTDTMEVTAQMLGQANLPKTIVLTGAMIPIRFGSSDGVFNIGSALAFAQTLPHGVYVAMNGRYFTWDNVHKNRERGIFEEKKRTE